MEGRRDGGTEGWSNGGRGWGEGIDAIKYAEPAARGFPSPPAEEKALCDRPGVNTRKPRQARNATEI